MIDVLTLAISIESSDVNPVLDWIEEHDGFLMLLATLGLILVTGAYVKFTRDLVKFQQAPLRREILENVFPELEDNMRSVLRGNSPDSLSTYWRKLRHTKSFFVYTPLFPRELCAFLDEFADEPREAVADYELVRGKLAELSLNNPPKGVPQPDPSALPGIKYCTLRWIVLNALEPGISVGEVIPIRTSYEYIWTNEGQSWPGGAPISWGDLENRVQELRDQLMANAELTPVLKRHRELLKRIAEMLSKLDENRRHGTR